MTNTMPNEMKVVCDKMLTMLNAAEQKRVSIPKQNEHGVRGDAIEECLRMIIFQYGYVLYYDRNFHTGKRVFHYTNRVTNP